MELVGINNEMEFYSNHYLSEILHKDLKDVFARWKEEKEKTGQRAPFEHLGGLRKEYFDTQNALEREKDEAKRLELQRDFVAKLLEVLGYPYQPGVRDAEDDVLIPVLGEIKKSSGAPELWVLEAVKNGGDGMDPLSQEIQPLQMDELPKELEGLSWEDVVTKYVFSRPEPPRWVLLLDDSQAVLLDRGKWNDKRLLRFDWSEILDRRDGPTLQAAAALLHRDSVCPAEGSSLLDSLDENSHKHAHGVSQDLKYALREAIELLGNEVVNYLRSTRKKGVFESGELVDEKDLSIECLRVMYRLLFLFYVESRPELGYAPVQVEAYRKGYSLDSLRDLEMIHLTTEESRNGTYLHESIQLLFQMVFEGFQPKGVGQEQVLGLEKKPMHFNFSMEPLRAHLFDPKRTPTFDKVKVRNVVWQKIIELLSLSRDKGGKYSRRGRVSYAQLGINQLGAVYEALLSFSGFFAREDLYEVKSAKVQGRPDELDIAYFVPEADLDKYEEDERVYNDDGTLRKYEKGKFIYRLAGRDRQSSASYYTPESLTRTLVKYALKELLEDEDGKLKRSADDLLDITVCEPAMGSAAFLNEAINQIAELYLRTKQEELGESIPHDKYAYELQRVKMFLADNRVFGVDLNPVAVELAEVSLWLNSIHEGNFVPWFGGQLVCGNSLIGARRQVFGSEKLQGGNGKNDDSWLDAVPDRVPLGQKRPEGAVYHFLLGDRGMSVYGQGNEGKPIKAMAKEELALIEKWRKDFCSPLRELERKNLVKLSEAIDKLWDNHVRVLRQVREKTTDPLQLYGHPETLEGRAPTPTAYKDSVWRGEVLSEGLKASSPYRRLKLAMDYWCALWFWPIQQADMLPTRAEFMQDLSLLLDTNVVPTDSGQGQRDLFAPTMPEQFSIEMKDSVGIVDVDQLVIKRDRLRLAQEIAARQRFMHWELEFADLFAKEKGFDLVIGNPPWIKIEWVAGDILGDIDPGLVLKELSASKLLEEIPNKIVTEDNNNYFLDMYSGAVGTKKYTNAIQNYHLLSGVQSNLYKCFVVLGWGLCNVDGVSALVTDKGLYDDAKAGELRSYCYQRLRMHFKFRNQFSLFRLGAGDNNKEFEIAVYGPPRDLIEFSSCSHLLHPSTIDSCYQSDLSGKIPPIKDEAGKWVLIGHPRRIVHVGKIELELFASSYDPPGTDALCARLPALYSQEAVSVLRKLNTDIQRLSTVDGEYSSSSMWDETNRQKDGTIKRNTIFPEHLGRWIVSGPHFSINSPLWKTPHRECNSQNAYHVLDLHVVNESYIPRTNYLPKAEDTEYKSIIPNVKFGGAGKVTDYYRLFHRRMLNQPGERTFISSIFPKEVGHIHTVISTVFRDHDVLVGAAAVASSLPFDFFVKTTGKSDFTAGNVSLIPIVNNCPDLLSCMKVRTLLLNCVAEYYSELWHDQFSASYKADSMCITCGKNLDVRYDSLCARWKRSEVPKSMLVRRALQLEIDVLVAMAIGMSLEDLIAIYRMQFPVMRQYESDTWYDANGRIVFTCNSKGLVGVGLPRKSKKGEDTPGWEDVKDMKSGTVEQIVMDDTLPGGPREKKITYVAPFDRCDRERDYEVVWAEFEKRFGKTRTKK